MYLLLRYNIVSDKAHVILISHKTRAVLWTCSNSTLFAHDTALVHTSLSVNTRGRFKKYRILKLFSETTEARPISTTRLQCAIIIVHFKQV